MTVTLPDTRRGAKDSITVTISEGELTRDYIHLRGEVKGGKPGYSDGGHVVDGCIRGDQLDRLIITLQLVAAEADKLGLRTARPIPKVKLA